MYFFGLASTSDAITPLAPSAIASHDGVLVASPHTFMSLLEHAVCCTGSIEGAFDPRRAVAGGITD